MADDLTWQQIDQLIHLYPLPTREPEEDQYEDIRERARERAEEDDFVLVCRKERR